MKYRLKPYCTSLRVSFGHSPSGRSLERTAAVGWRIRSTRCSKAAAESPPDLRNIQIAGEPGCNLAPSALLGQVLDEIRELRARFDYVRPIAPGVRLVKETELPKYIPWPIKLIKKARKAGKLVALPDPLHPGKYLYNLDDVLATVREGKPAMSKPRIKPRADLEI